MNTQSALTIVVPVNNHVFILFVRMFCLLSLFLTVFAEPPVQTDALPTHSLLCVTVESGFTGLEISIFSKK